MRLWGGQTVSSVGQGIVKLAAPLLVLALTESPTLAGLVVGALNVPMIFLGLPAGALVDRWDRRKVMMTCDVGRCVAVLTVPLMWLSGLLEGWWLLVVALALGSAQSFYTICQISALPRVVAKRHIPAAQALNATSESVAQLVSPGLGGLIVAAGSTAVVGGVMAYGVNGLTFLVSVLALAGISTPFQGARSRAEQPSILRSIREGVRFVVRDRAIRMLMVLNGLQRMGFAPLMLTVVVLARDDLGLDPVQIGMLFMVSGAGGLTGAAVTPWLRRHVPIGRHVVGAVSLHAIALGVVTVAPNVWLMLPGLYLAGLMELTNGVSQVSYRVALIPDAIQGRVNSVYRMTSFGSMSVGTALGGLLIDLYGPRTMMGIIASWLGVVAIGAALSGIRSLRD